MILRVVWDFLLEDCWKGVVDFFVGGLLERCVYIVARMNIQNMQVILMCVKSRCAFFEIETFL